jgi:hypothetical protein
MMRADLLFTGLIAAALLIGFGVRLVALILS